jgi:DNA-binding LacI/PurR family transcriptional regulator
MSATPGQLAQLLEKDIRDRGLGLGHRYLTGEESARLWGTSVATANRALQILAEQDIVVRRRSSGTFVGPAAVRQDMAGIRTLSILTPASDKPHRSVVLDPLVEGLLASLTDVTDVRFSYVPSDRDVDFVRSLVEPMRSAGQLVAVVAVSCSYDVYRFLGEDRYPLVVMGSLYSGQTYPSVGTDERQAGYLLAHYLLERGHRRLAVLSHSEACPGDHHFHDGMSEALTEARVPHNALVLRAPGTKSEVLQHEVRELLAMPDRPTGFVVKLPRWVDDVAGHVRDYGLRVPQDIEITYRAVLGSGSEDTAYSHVRPSASNLEIATLVGRMLAQVRQGNPLEPSTVVIPYELRTVSTDN